MQVVTDPAAVILKTVPPPTEATISFDGTPTPQPFVARTRM